MTKSARSGATGREDAMATKTKFATWHKEGRLFIVRPPNWPKNCELSFTEQEAMVEWAAAAHVMLRDGNKRQIGGYRNYGDAYAANA
jgi:hypothetical protein